MGKGSDKQSMSVPQYQEDLGRGAASLAEQIAQLGYTPYYGPDVAAFAPQQMAAFQNTNNMAQAFGMGGGAVNMPQAQNFNGIMGYSSAPMFEAAQQQLAQRNPGQYAALQPGGMAQPVQQGGKGGGAPAEGRYFSMNPGDSDQRGQRVYY